MILTSSCSRLCPIHWSQVLSWESEWSTIKLPTKVRLILETWRYMPDCQHDDVIKWKHFPRYWPFVRGIHRSPVNSPHKGQWRGALIFSFICVWINSWVNNREAGDVRRYRAQYDVIIMRPDPIKNVSADNFPNINDVLQWLGWTHFPWVLSFSDLFRTFFKRIFQWKPS